MNSRSWYHPATVFVLAAASPWTAVTSAQPHAIDTQKSVMTVRAYKSGLFSAFAHDHEIGAPFAGGRADTAAHIVEFRVEAGALRVLDPKVSEKDREEIRKTMLGPTVLDTQRYPEIVFRSTAVEPSGPDSWKVRGDLMLHGQTRSIAVEVSDRSGHFVGSAQLKQTDFGIKPIRIAGGTVQVKDQIRIEFDVQLAR